MSKASPEDGFASNGLKDGDEEEDIYEFYFNSVRSIDPPPRNLSSFFLIRVFPRRTALIVITWNRNTEIYLNMYTFVCLILNH